MSSDAPSVPILAAFAADGSERASSGETETRLGDLSLADHAQRRGTGPGLARRSFERSRSPGDVSGNSSPVERPQHFLGSSGSLGSEKRAHSPQGGSSWSFPSTSSASSTPVGTPTMPSAQLPSISGSRSPNGRSQSLSAGSSSDPFNFAGSPSLSNRPLEAAKHQHHRSRSINMGGFSPVMKGGKLINFGSGPVSISGPSGDSSSSDGSNSSNPGSPLSSSPASGSAQGSGLDPSALGPGFSYTLPRAPSPLQQSHTMGLSPAADSDSLGAAGSSTSPTLAPPLSTSPSEFSMTYNPRDSRTIDFATAARGWESPQLTPTSLPLPIPIGQHSLTSLRAAAAASERARSPKPLYLGEPQVTASSVVGGSMSDAPDHHASASPKANHSTTNSAPTRRTSGHFQQDGTSSSSGPTRRASGQFLNDALLSSPKFKTIPLTSPSPSPSHSAQAALPISTNGGSLPSHSRPISPRLNAWAGNTSDISPGTSPSPSSYTFSSSPSARLARSRSPSLRVSQPEAGPSRSRTPSPARSGKGSTISRGASMSPPLEPESSIGRAAVASPSKWDTSWPDLGNGSRAVSIGRSSSPNSPAGGIRLERGLSGGSNSSGGGSPGTSPVTSAAGGFLGAAAGLGIGSASWKFPASPRGSDSKLLGPHARVGRGPRSDTSRSRTPSPGANHLETQLHRPRGLEGESGPARPKAIWPSAESRPEVLQSSTRELLLARSRSVSSSSNSSQGSDGGTSEEDSPVRIRPTSRLAHARTVSMDSAQENGGRSPSRPIRSLQAGKHNRKVSDPIPASLQSPPSAMRIAHGSAKAEVDARMALSENTKGKAGAAGGLIADEVDAFSDHLPPPALPVNGMAVDEPDPLARSASSSSTTGLGSASASLNQLVRPTPVDARLLPPFASSSMSRSGSGTSLNALGLGGSEGLSSGLHSPANAFGIQAPHSPRMGSAPLAVPERMLLGLRSRSPSPAAAITPNPFDPLRRQSPSPSTLSNNFDAMNGESPPKMRSFIGMPPRSGYDLSDDPDDVGSEGDASSASSTDGREGSIGGGDDDGMDESQDHDDDIAAGRRQRGSGELEDDDDSNARSALASRRTGLPSDITRSTLFARRQNASGSSDGSEGDLESIRDGDGDELNGREQRRGMRESRAPSPPAEGSDVSSRPIMPRKPSLTRSNAVPPPPELDDEGDRIGGAGPSSVLGFFHGDEAESQLDDSSDWGAPLSRQTGSAGRELHIVSQDDDEGDTSLSQDADWMPPSSQGPGSDVDDPTSESDEALTTLERIFLFAKSEMTYHRILVSQCLAEWILDVKLSDAVEYVIPLLNGLSTDEREVCEAFSPELHRIMWFFFRNCPLKQVEAARAEGEAGQPTGSVHVNGSALETATRPQLDVGTFTPLLCALLLNQQHEIARSTQNAIVQFCSRLHRDSEGSLLSDDGSWAPELSERCEGDHTFLITSTVNRDGKDILYEPYHFGPEARQIVEQEILLNVAIAIGSQNAHQPQEEEKGKLTALTESGHEGDKENEPASTPMQKSGSGEGHSASQDTSSSQDTSTTSEPGESSRDDSSWDPESQIDSQMEDVWRSDGALFDASSPHLGPFTRGEFDEEAAVARMAGVGMLAALAAEGILHIDIITQTFVPQMVSLQKDPAFFVRKEVAVSLGILAKSVTDRQVVQDELLPTLDAHLRDNIWHVRQAACLSMPAVLTKTDDETQRVRAVTYLRGLVKDVSRNVRQAALEVIGELVFLFHEKEGGVPEELIRFFLGEPLGELDEEMAEDSKGADSKLPSRLELSNPSSDFGFVDALQMNSESAWGGGMGGMGMFGQTDVHERAVVTAFNFPAVAFTMGAKHWARLQPLHADLAQDHAVKVRRSLASSLHEIAKIIGPESTHSDLLPIFDRFLQDQESEIKTAVVENVDVFLAQLPQEQALSELRSMQDRWLHAFGRDWRLRERLAQHVSTMADDFLLVDEDANLIALMQLAIADPVSAVRDAGIVSIAKMYTIFSEHDQAAADGFLALVDDLGNSSSYRIRVASLMAIEALVHGSIQRAALETILLERLVAAADDDVIDVRIVLGRCVAAMCQKDELYGLTQSRSPELLELISKLARDVSPEVRQPIHTLLSEEDVVLAESQALENASAAPKSSTRILVLGPKDGGPHREARTSICTVVSMDQSADPDREEEEEDMPAFAMDEDVDQDSQRPDDGPGSAPLSTLSGPPIRIDDASSTEAELASAAARSSVLSQNFAGEGDDASIGDITHVHHTDSSDEEEGYAEESQMLDNDDEDEDVGRNVFTQRATS